MGVDEPPSGHCLFQLHAQPSDINIDRPVAWPHFSTPSQAKQVLPRHDPIGAAGELGQQMKLSDRENQGPPPRPGDVLIRKDLKRSYFDHFVAGGSGKRQRLSGGRQRAEDGAPTPNFGRYLDVTRM